jgi:hypothetical protein
MGLAIALGISRGDIHSFADKNRELEIKLVQLQRAN